MIIPHEEPILLILFSCRILLQYSSDREYEEIYTDSQYQKYTHHLNTSQVFPRIKESKKVFRDQYYDNNIEKVEYGKDQGIEHTF